LLLESPIFLLLFRLFVATVFCVCIRFWSNQPRKFRSRGVLQCQKKRQVRRHALLRDFSVDEKIVFFRRALQNREVIIGEKYEG